MKLWKRNAVVAAIVLFVCVAVYLNWSYGKENKEGEQDAGKLLGQATLVGKTQKDDPLLAGATPTPGVTADPGTDGDAAASPAPQTRSSTGYFASARLNRQQARDSALAILRETMASENAEESAKLEAGAAIEALASSTVSEAQIENLVIAKGYTDCVAFISEGGVSVVVSATEGGLQDADVAKIAEIVTGETGVPMSQINIIEAQG